MGNEKNFRHPRDYAIIALTDHRSHTVCKFIKEKAGSHWGLIASRSAPLAPTMPHSTLAPIASTHSRGAEFPEVVAKWRTAELAVLNWLNSRAASSLMCASRTSDMTLSGWDRMATAP